MTSRIQFPSAATVPATERKSPPTRVLALTTIHEGEGSGSGGTSLQPCHRRRSSASVHWADDLESASDSRRPSRNSKVNPPSHHKHHSGRSRPVNSILLNPGAIPTRYPTFTDPFEALCGGGHPRAADDSVQSDKPKRPIGPTRSKSLGWLTSQDDWISSFAVKVTAFSGWEEGAQRVSEWSRRTGDESDGGAESGSEDSGRERIMRARRARAQARRTDMARTISAPSRVVYHDEFEVDCTLTAGRSGAISPVVSSASSSRSVSSDSLRSLSPSRGSSPTSTPSTSAHTSPMSKVVELPYLSAIRAKEQDPDDLARRFLQSQDRMMMGLPGMAEKALDFPLREKTSSFTRLRSALYGEDDDDGSYSSDESDDDEDDHPIYRASLVSSPVSETPVSTSLDTLESPMSSFYRKRSVTDFVNLRMEAEDGSTNIGGQAGGVATGASRSSGGGDDKHGSQPKGVVGGLMDLAIGVATLF